MFMGGKENSSKRQDREIKNLRSETECDAVVILHRHKVRLIGRRSSKRRILPKQVRLTDSTGSRPRDRSPEGGERSFQRNWADNEAA